ncbi:MAG: ATP-binding cassette domain-containing protein [Gammaproteobacteria bacterium]|nr:ATP-binding cassette domain-containing protein [Gammaproteobacteria bacterium]MBL6999770.1 ATP-binding cassette domain-containing protein [Gammaproteobacteria bacterium]
MPILTLKDLYHSFGSRPVLDHVTLSIDKGERICLVGRNGTGKSTLLKLIAGQMKADEGEVIYSQGIRVGELRQDVPQSIPGSIYDVVAEGVGELGRAIRDWHHACLAAAYDPDALTQLEKNQQIIEAQNGWTLEQRISSTISLLKLPAEEAFDAQSGGLKRRTLLAQALVSQPDLLLLDEPTNHLDIDAILWLEEFLKSFSGAILFITHDRSFLQSLATRIIDLDRGQLTSWPGSYEKYLTNKQQQLDAEQTANALFDKKLAQEEVWIRQGIKARRTRNEGRVRALKKLREQRSERREHSGTARLATHRADASGKIVIEAEHIGFKWQQTQIVDDFSCKIQRGDKIGIIGPNGCGKTTLIQLLLGEIAPQSGTLKTGTKLEIAYFDQHRNELDLNKSVRENIADGADTVDINGSNKHVIGYLKDFLFSSDQINTPVKALSGGERNRLMLARLFTRPFNFLIMDEPTNDLDMDTLELLEELLMEYQGTLLLVSHDREFINNIVDYCFAFEANAKVNEYVGGYDDWLKQRPQIQSAVKKPTPASANTLKPKVVRKKLDFNEQKELKALPRKIEKQEQLIGQTQQQMADPEFYQKSAEVMQAAQLKLAQQEQELKQLYTRWELLEDDS